ncbi:sensor histidine kinase [Caenimonas soli]|uniref:sensor histidine kinase n=1 Tax=Caenimonas soli TaxID=2735555 RepID=UPI001551EF28|nr:diguanylate cyclase [Caenimonas soli]NPC56337.1 diguanylate cyclase [Caenimonas soli]
MDAARAAHLLEANQQLVLAVIRAQDEAAAAAQALRDLARSPHIEALTEQPDGALLFDRLAHALAVARRKLSKLGLLFVSVDNLEDINNTLGHARGEQVLKLAAQRLASAVRGSDTVSRQGSHEFLILLTDLSHARDALTVADSIVAAMALPGQVGGQQVSLRASIGISVFPDDGNDGDALIDRATAAMYNARRRGVGSYFFRDEAATKERSLALRTAEWLRRISGSVAPYGDPGTAEHRREANEQLLLAALRSQQLQDAAELAYRRQTELMGVVAHELRQPLGPITMAASMLATEGAAEPSVMPIVKGVIERQVALMTRLVGDLLDMTRVSTGKLRLDIHRMDMARVISEVVSDLRPAVEARLQQLHVELPPGELTVNGDRLRLCQVMSNLISNACKYTQHGGSIEVSATASEGTLAISVTDNGIGISAKALPHIFDPFMQEHRATSFDGSGLGIGLSLVRELVQAHGGQVTAESKGRGQGSRFTLTLPLLRVA